MTLSPLGLSVGRSAARLGGIALYLTASTAMTAVLIAYDGSMATWIATMSDIGEGLLSDSSWSLPAILAVNVALIVVVAAQSFAGSTPDETARTHSVIAVISQTGGAFALMTVVFSILRAIIAPDDARHLVAACFLAVLVIIFGLWANVVVFGKPRESLRLSKASRDLATASLKNLHQPTHTKGLAWFTVIVPMLAIGLGASLIPVAISLIQFGSFIGPVPWVLTCLSIVAFASIIAGSGAAILAVSERGVSAWLMYIVIVGAVTVFPAAVIITHVRDSQLVAVVLAFLFVAPVIGTWVPYGDTLPRISRFGFGNAIRSLVHVSVSARVVRINALIRNLEAELTPLDLSASRTDRN
jgi:hypothetical protein